MPRVVKISGIKAGLDDCDATPETAVLGLVVPAVAVVPALGGLRV